MLSFEPPQESGTSPHILSLCAGSKYLEKKFRLGPNGYVQPFPTNSQSIYGDLTFKEKYYVLPNTSAEDIMNVISKNLKLYLTLRSSRHNDGSLTFRDGIFEEVILINSPFVISGLVFQDTIGEEPLRARVDRFLSQGTSLSISIQL